MKYQHLIIFIFLLTACDEENKSISVTQCFPMSNDAELYSRTLHDLAVPHTFNTAEKCIYGGVILSNKEEEYKLAAFGSPPPPGLSTTYKDSNSQFVDLLASNGVITTTIKYKGVDWIVWKHEDHEKAEEILEFEPWLKELMKKARDEAK